MFIGMPDSLRQKMLSFYEDAMTTKAPREDYLELLRLCYVFLGGSFDRTAGFRAPGAIHNARWMAKAIYSLKIFLFQGQFKLTVRGHHLYPHGRV